MALAAINGEKTLAELAQSFGMQANQITAWKARLVGGAAEVFGGSASGALAPAVDVKALHGNRCDGSTWQSRARATRLSG